MEVLNLGDKTKVYISIATSSLDCGYSTGNSLNLPNPTPRTYICAPSSTYRNIDGTGWVPVNFTNLSIQSPLTILPIDPVNIVANGYYYTYAPGSWELTTAMESAKYQTEKGPIVQVGTEKNITPKILLSANRVPYPIPTNGLVAYYKFEEGGSATTAIDSSGNNNNGTWYGTGTHYVAGKVGNYAGQFNGSNDYVIVPDSDSLDFTTQLSISVWVKKENFNNNFDAFLRKESSFNLFDIKPGAYGGYPNGELYLDLYIGGSWRRVTCSSFPSSSAWRHVVGIYNGSYIKLYINGAEAASISQTGSINVTANDLWIGQQSAGGAAYIGLFDEVAIYNRALSASEISDIYNGQR